MSSPDRIAEALDSLIYATSDTRAEWIAFVRAAVALRANLVDALWTPAAAEKVVDAFDRAARELGLPV